MLCAAQWNSSTALIQPGLELMLFGLKAVPTTYSTISFLVLGVMRNGNEVPLKTLQSRRVNNGYSMYVSGLDSR